MDPPTYPPDGMAGGAPAAVGGSAYAAHATQVAQLIESKKGAWNGINAESVARMRLQNRLQTGLDIARYTAKVRRPLRKSTSTKPSPLRSASPNTSVQKIPIIKPHPLA